MRALWKGAVSFGLVTIPVSLYPATRREELKFRMLRRSDHSPINYKRVAEANGKEVPWNQVVKGYEYEKGEYVILKEEDFARVDVEATQTVDIMNFVSIDDVDPVLFHKPYYLEVGKGGDKAYILLRDALLKSGKTAIAKVVIRARQHLAAVKAQNKLLILELMYFPNELIDASQFKVPSGRSASRSEMKMAEQLIESMSSEWKPENYTDDYSESLENLIEEKIEHGDKATPAPPRKKRPSNVVDLVSVLKESIEQTQERGKAAKRETEKREKPRKSRDHKKAA
jgi:DNA end-binding protein Ku